MPELPDYRCIATRWRRASAARRWSASDPESVRAAHGRAPDQRRPKVARRRRVRRLGKRIVLALEGDVFLVLHLMIAGRLRWLDRDAKPPARITLAIFEFADGHARAYTEAGTKRRRGAAFRSRRQGARDASTRAASRLLDIDSRRRSPRAFTTRESHAQSER